MRRMFTEKQLKKLIEDEQIILVSPDGTKYKLTVSNEGKLSVEPIVE